MSFDLQPLFASTPVVAAPHAADMPRSAILAIAASVREIRDRPVADFTVGDFDPCQFPAPEALIEGVAAALREGHSNYPPAPGVAELRQAIVTAAERDFGVRWPVRSAVVGSGARPPIYAAFQTLVSPGDRVVYGVPCWNTPYYVHLRAAVPVEVPTRAADGFLPTPQALRPHLGTARLVVINTPSNPVGTLLPEAHVAEICHDIVRENAQRAREGRPALFLLYDQVYRELIYDGSVHAVPARLVPEVAPYTLHVDAISKSMAATGLRVGWVLAPPAIAEALTTWIGHMGAWAGRAEQIATARLLVEPDRTAAHARALREGLSARLNRLAAGLQGLRAQGLDVEVVPPVAALYLSARIGGHGRDESLRRWLLDAAGIAVVPMSAFGMPDSEWVRFSVGAVALHDIDAAMTRLAHAIS